MKIIITESQKQMLIESVNSFVVKEIPDKGKGVIVNMIRSSIQDRGVKSSL
jgi:hypothetical protein